MASKVLPIEDQRANQAGENTKLTTKKQIEEYLESVAGKKKIQLWKKEVSLIQCLSMSPNEEYIMIGVKYKDDTHFLLIIDPKKLREENFMQEQAVREEKMENGVYSVHFQKGIFYVGLWDWRILYKGEGDEEFREIGEMSHTINNISQLDQKGEFFIASEQGYSLKLWRNDDIKHSKLDCLKEIQKYDHNLSEIYTARTIIFNGEEYLIVGGEPASLIFKINKNWVLEEVKRLKGVNVKNVEVVNSECFVASDYKSGKTYLVNL